MSTQTKPAKPSHTIFAVIFGREGSSVAELLRDACDTEVLEFGEECSDVVRVRVEASGLRTVLARLKRLINDGEEVVIYSSLESAKRDESSAAHEAWMRGDMASVRALTRTFVDDPRLPYYVYIEPDALPRAARECPRANWALADDELVWASVASESTLRRLNAQLEKAGCRPSIWTPWNREQAARALLAKVAP